MHTMLVRVSYKIGVRRKWLNHFACAEALVYVVDLSCYDEWVEIAETEETLVRPSSGHAFRFPSRANPCRLLIIPAEPHASRDA